MKCIALFVIWSIWFSDPVRKDFGTEDVAEKSIRRNSLHQGKEQRMFLDLDLVSVSRLSFANPLFLRPVSGGDNQLPTWEVWR